MLGLHAIEYTNFETEHINKLYYSNTGKVIMEMKDHTKYEIGVKGKSVADMNNLHLRDWKEIAEGIDRLLTGKHILEAGRGNCPTLRTLDQLSINDDGVNYYAPGAGEGGRFIAHDCTDDGMADTAAIYTKLKEDAKGHIVMNHNRPNGRVNPQPNGAARPGAPLPANGAGDVVTRRLSHPETINQAAATATVEPAYVTGTMTPAIKRQIEIVANTETEGGHRSYVSANGDILNLHGYLNKLTSDDTITAAVTAMGALPDGKNDAIRAATKQLLISISGDLCAQWLGKQVDGAIQAVPNWQRAVRNNRDAVATIAARNLATQCNDAYTKDDAGQKITDDDLRTRVRDEQFTEAYIQPLALARAQQLNQNGGGNSSSFRNLVGSVTSFMPSGNGLVDWWKRNW